MPFVYCPTCDKPSSPKAASCLGCGHPLTAPELRELPNVQTVEQTGKGWKAGMLVSVVLLLGGWTACIAPTDGDPGIRITLGTLAFVAGVAGYAYTRIGAWWFHG